MAEGRKEAETTPPPEDWMTLNAAANALGISRLTILTLGYDRVFEIDRRADLTFVSRRSVEAFRAKQRAEPLAATA